MAINLASKFSSKVDERFKLGSLTAIGVNQNYEWSGVVTVSVYAIGTVALGDYTRTGANRYGTPTELADTKQDMTLSQDRSFSMTIDKGNNTEQMMVKGANKALRREIDELIIPEIDAYRLATMSAAGISNGATDATPATALIAYKQLLDAGETLDEAKVPQTGRVAFVTPVFYSFLKQDNSFVLASEMGMKIKISGLVGEVDGVKIIKVPSSYFPATHSFILTHKVATVAPKKLEDYKIHMDPPGINGHLIEGRFIHDAFVLDSKVDAIFVQTTA